MKTLTTTITSTIEASAHSRVNADTSAANSRMASSGFLSCASSVWSADRAGLSRIRFGPYRPARSAAAADVRPLGLERSASTERAARSPSIG
jgi:hypothetical protein